MNRWVLIGFFLIGLGLLYRRNPTMFRRGIWMKTSIAIRTLSPEKYVAYIRGGGLMLILVGVGMLLYGLDPLIAAVTFGTIDWLRLTPTERAVTGMLVGAVGGAPGGWIGAFLEALYLHPLGRILEPAGRIAIAEHLASIGSKIGLILGAIVGGVVGGFSSLAMGLVTMTALVVLAIAAHARSRLRADPWVRGATIGAAFMGAAFSYLITVHLSIDR